MQRHLMHSNNKISCLFDNTGYSAIIEGFVCILMEVNNLLNNGTISYQKTKDYLLAYNVYIYTQE